jgi:hypothetical protein
MKHGALCVKLGYWRGAKRGLRGGVLYKVLAVLVLYCAVMVQNRC